MTANVGFRTRTALGGMAAAGVVAAHELAYRVALPESHHRAEVLASTGHGYWHLVIALALGAAVAGLCRVARGSEPEPSLARTALRLCLIQLVAFLALEFSERALTGSHGGGLLREPAVQLGLGLQVIAAALGAIVLKLFTRVAALLRAAVSPVARDRDPLIPVPVGQVFVRTRPKTAPASPRAPPVGMV